MITHALETRSEMFYNLERYGKPALQRLADIGVLTPETVLEHFVWVTDEELRDLRGFGGGRVERPRVEPAAVERHLPRARHHGYGRADRVRHRRHLVLRSRGLLPGAAARLLPAADAADVRAAAAGQRGGAPRRCRRTGLAPSGWRTGSDRSSPAGCADLLIVDKERILFPPGRYDHEPFLDVVLDRAEAADIDTVMVHGRVVMEGGRVTVVDEDAVKERFAAAVHDRVYRFPEHVQRWAELGRLGRAVRDRLLPALVRDAGGARLRLQRETAAGGGAVIIDAHSHILSLAEDPEFTIEYGREGSLCIYRSMGLLPSHRMPTEEEWEASGFTRKGWPVIGPEESLRDHPGFDKVVVLGDLAAVAGRPADRDGGHDRGPRRRRADASRPLQRLHRRGRAHRPRSVHRVRVREPAVPGARGGGRPSSSEPSSSLGSRA